MSLMLAEQLESQMYQQVDYIITQGEVTSEMHFLHEITALLLQVVQQVTILYTILL